MNVTTPRAIIGDFAAQLAANPPREIRGLIKFLKEIYVSDISYKEYIRKEFSDHKDYESRKSLLEGEFFLGRDFASFIIYGIEGGGVSPEVTSILLDRLIQWNLVNDLGILIPNGYVKYQWVRSKVEAFLGLEILDNVLLGAAYIAEKYRKSVPAIFVEKGGDHFTGTGFVASIDVGRNIAFVITAKHNIDPNDGITFQDFSNPEGVIYTPLDGIWRIHPDLDLACIPVRVSAPVTPIFPFGTARVLSRTITLGYPRIATTDAPYLLAHSGELNAVVSTFFGEDRLILSNLVAPGNSGGPVLDEAGLCVGIIVNSFETKHLGGTMSKANSAIPSSKINDFLMSCRI